MPVFDESQGASDRNRCEVADQEKQEDRTHDGMTKMGVRGGRKGFCRIGESKSNTADRDQDGDCKQRRTLPKVRELAAD